MGEADRYHSLEEKRRKRNRLPLGADDNALMMLFALNVVFFLVLMVIQVGVFAGNHDQDYFFTHVVQWFQMPAGLTRLSERPWTFISYMFCDTGTNIIRLISNMIWLWAFGYLFRETAGNDKIIPVYLYGGILGAVFFIAANYLLAPLIPLRGTAALLGANGGVLAIAMAATTMEPGFRFFRQLRGGIPIWVLMGIYLLIDFASIAGSSAAYRFSHLGGAIAGFLFVLFLRRGYDAGAWMNNFYRWFSTVFDPPKSGNADKTKEHVFYDSGSRKPFTKTTGITQKRLDEILDKINRDGYSSLSPEEKEYLKKAAEDDTL